MSGPGDTRDVWFRSPRRLPEAGVRLLFFPHAGGAANAYFRLGRGLAPAVEVLAVQYPGRQDRLHQPVVTELPDLARQVFEALGQELDQRPLAFFGHSMGATVAYEVARRLEHERGVKLRRLFVSARNAPSRSRRERMVHLRDDEGLVAELTMLRGTHAGLLDDLEMRQFILPAVRGDYAAIERYQWRPGPELSCPVTVLIGEEDPLTTLDEARAWAGHSAAGADVRVFPGGHFYLDEHPEQVARLIAEHLTGPA